MPERLESPVTYEDKGDPNASIGSGWGGDIPGQSESLVVNAFWKRYEQLRNYKSSQVNPKDWKRYVMVYGDQHWDGTQRDWQSTPTINLTFAAINTVLAIVTDQKPDVAVIAREPDDAHIADVIRAVIDWLWEENNCDQLLPKTMLNTFIFGNGFWKLFYNPKKNRTGDIDIINVDPTQIFVNPEATTLDDCEELYHVEQMSMGKVWDMYPELVDRIRPGVKDPTILIHRPQMAQKQTGTMGTIDVRTTTGTSVSTYPAGSSVIEQLAPKETCTVAERWAIDRETGRWRKTVVANKVLLEDTLTEEKILPYVHFVDYPVPWTLWASGEIQHVENLQYEINKRRGMILDILRFCSSPMLVVDPATGTDTDAMESRPGLVIPAEGGPKGVGWLVPQMDLGGLFNVNQRDKADFQDILGNVDVMQGKRPEGIEAAAAIEALQESANTRIRPKVRNMEASLRRAGKILVSLIQRYYTGMRIFRIVGKDFLDDGTAAPATSQDYFAINKPTGQMTGERDEDGNPIPETENTIPPDAEFDLKIGAGSTLPVSRTARFQQAITLYDRHIVDAQEVLKNSGWPRWQEVLARMQAAQQAQQAAMQGQAPQAGPQAAAQIPSSIDQVIGPQVQLGGGMAPGQAGQRPMRRSA